MGKAHGYSGGGIEGKNVGHYRDPMQEPRPHSVSVGAVSRLGGMVGEGTPYKNLYNKQGYTTPLGPTDNMGAGPGANRMVMRAGSQAPTPSPTPMGRGRSLFK
jgi:hypothetical protein